MDAPSDDEVPQQTPQQFYDASANAREGSRPQSDPPSMEPAIEPEYRLENAAKYGTDDVQKINFLEQRLQNQIEALGALHVHLGELDSDPVGSAVSGRGARPTVGVLAQRVETLETGLRKLVETSISATTNSVETMVYWLDQLRNAERSAVVAAAAGGATRAKGRQPRKATAAEASKAKVSCLSSSPPDLY